jgi:ubiquinone/menaquinone biosynthesis C-methylase UbiE
VAEKKDVPNVAQVKRWNGETGQYWAANRERHLAEHERLTLHLFSAIGISRGERILDIGCGCGETTIAAARAAGGARHDSGGFAVGLDLSAPMLEVAYQLATQARVPNVSFLQADAQACPLREYSCDVVISSFGVMFFDDPAAAFTSIAQAVRPSGRLAFLCWQADIHNELLSIPIRAFRDHVQLPSSAVSDLFFDSQRVTRLLSATGWTDIRIDALSELAWIGADVPEVMKYVRGMPTIRALAASLDDKALAERVFAALADEYAGRQHGDGVWVQAAAWLVTAHRA